MQSVQLIGSEYVSKVQIHLSKSEKLRCENDLFYCLVHLVCLHFRLGKDKLILSVVIDFQTSLEKACIGVIRG
jgi:hypothetical protein